MRIAMVCGHGDPTRDGVADYVGHLSRTLRELAVDVLVVRGTRVRGVARAVRIADADVVHVHFAPSAYGFSGRIGVLPELLRPCPPLVTTLHEYGTWASPSWLPERVWQLLEKRHVLDRETWRLIMRSAAVVTTNAEHARALAVRAGIRAVHVPLAPNVTDRATRVRRDSVRRRLGVPAAAQVVAFFGFVHPVKGLRYLIDAVAMLHQDGRKQVHLLVIGGFTSLALPEPAAGAFRAELEAQVRARGLAGHVTISGYLPAPAVSEALHAADVAVFPFTAGVTTKSGALLSAFAHQLPTLVTAANPPDPDLVDGETVISTPRARDPGALASGLARLLDDPQLRTRIARGAAKLVASRGWSVVAAAHCELYARVVQPEVTDA